MALFFLFWETWNSFLSLLGLTSSVDPRHRQFRSDLIIRAPRFERGEKEVPCRVNNPFAIPKILFQGNRNTFFYKFINYFHVNYLPHYFLEIYLDELFFLWLETWRYRYPNAPQSMSIELHRIEGLRVVLDSSSSRCPSIEMVIDTNQKKDDDDGALVRKRGSMTQQHVASAMESARPNPQRPAGRLLFWWSAAAALRLHHPLLLLWW